MEDRRTRLDGVVDRAESYLRAQPGSRMCAKCLMEVLGANPALGRVVLPRLEGRRPPLTVRYDRCSRCANVRLVVWAGDHGDDAPDERRVPDGAR
jgi:hypothetical protein